MNDQKTNQKEICGAESLGELSFFFLIIVIVYLIKITHVAEIKCYFILHIPCVHIFKEDENYS